MRHSLAVTGTSVAIFGLVIAGGSRADEDRDTPQIERGSTSLALALVDDLDGDGIPDGEDNCLEVSNEDQSDFDLDAVGDVCDNCSETPNPSQYDCDDDYCGNACDCDYDQTGACGWPDWGLFSSHFSTSWGDSDCYCHFNPYPGCIPGFPDFGFFSANFSLPPGPSGTTPGTAACPIWE
jgi:hypothetical protein